MNQLGQLVLQVESYSMDAILQIFKQSISSSTLFLEPTTMDNLFRRADKYTMLEDDVRVGSQQVLVNNHRTKNDKAGSFKTSNQLWQGNGRQDDQQQQQVRLAPLSISHERLFLLIHDLLDFKWLKPIKTDLTRWDWNRMCSYHKDHDHTTEQCKSIH